MSGEHFRCGGHVGPDATVEDLVARGFTEAGAREVIAMRDKLAEKHRRCTCGRMQRVRVYPRTWERVEDPECPVHREEG